MLGHEVAGVIREIAPDVETSLAVGDRVTVETDAYRCGRCEYCRKEEYNRCPYRLGIGTTVDGGLADQLVMPVETLHKLPDGLSLAAGALSEPLAVSVHAVIEQSPSLAGEVVVVIGPGAIGMLCAQVAHAVGRDGGAGGPQPARREARAGARASASTTPSTRRRQTSRSSSGR